MLYNGFMEEKNLLNELARALIYKPALIEDLAKSKAAGEDDSFDELLDSPSIVSQAPKWLAVAIDEFKEIPTYSCAGCGNTLSIADLYGRVTSGLSDDVSVEAACCCGQCGEICQVEYRLKPDFNKGQVILTGLTDEGDWDSSVAFKR